MNDGFKKVEVADPSKLTNFIEGTSGSVLAILSVDINSIAEKIPFKSCLFHPELEQHSLLQ